MATPAELAELHIKHDQRDKAIEVLESALQINPHQPELAEKLIELKWAKLSVTANQFLNSERKDRAAIEPIKGSLTFRFPKRIPYGFAILGAIVFALVFPQGGKPWFWLIIPTPLYIELIIFGIYTYKYSLTIDNNYISVEGFKRRKYSISEITDISLMNIYFDSAVIKFKDGKKLRITSFMKGFIELVELLRNRTGLINESLDSKLKAIKIRTSYRNPTALCVGIALSALGLASYLPFPDSLNSEIYGLRFVLIVIVPIAVGLRLRKSYNSLFALCTGILFSAVGLASLTSDFRFMLLVILPIYVGLLSGGYTHGGVSPPLKGFRR